MSFMDMPIPFDQAAYHGGDYNKIIPLCEKEITEGGPNKVRFVYFLSFTRIHVPFLSQGSATQGNLLSVDKAAKTGPPRADCSG